MEKIPVLDLRPDIDAHWDEYNAAIQEVLKTTAFIQGPDVKDFEADVSRYLGVKHSIGLNSGTDALLLALRAMDVGPGDEVITTAFTFFATAETISMLGATPVFVDIEPDTFNIDCNLIEKAITKKTKAIVPVHLYGHAADMDRIKTIAAKHGLKVLEDVAQAFSGKYRGQHLGTIGDAGAYSFFPSKNLGAFGDGGMLSTDDAELAGKVKMLSVHGARKKYFNEEVGYNSRLDTIQAAILKVKLKYIDQATEGRRRVAKMYKEALSGIPGIVTPTEKDYAYHSYHQYTLRVLNGKRDELQSKLNDLGVQTMIYYPIPQHKLKVYEHLNLSFPLAEQAASESLSIPIWPEMSGETVLKVAAAIKKTLA